MPETALVIAVPEAEPLVSDWRAQHDWSAQRGVPAHITLLYPFVPHGEGRRRAARPACASCFAAERRDLVRAGPRGPFPRGRLAGARAVGAVQALTELDRGALPGLPAVRGRPRRGHSAPDGRRGRSRTPGPSRGGALEAPADRAHADDVAFLFEDDEGLWHEAHRFRARRARPRPSRRAWPPPSSAPASSAARSRRNRPVPTRRPRPPARACRSRSPRRRPRRPRARGR